MSKSDDISLRFGAALKELSSIYHQDLRDMHTRKDIAYTERNLCVAALAEMATLLSYKVGIAKTPIEGWSEDWLNCVYIELPTGQVSWHYHDSEAYLFKHLPPYEAGWDGHSTEEKYLRVLGLLSIKKDDHA